MKGYFNFDRGAGVVLVVLQAVCFALGLPATWWAIAALCLIVLIGDVRIYLLERHHD